MNEPLNINKPEPAVGEIATALASYTGKGYVYATSYSNGMTKVGMSCTSPLDRIRVHNTGMRNAGANQVSQYISKEILHPRKIELMLIHALNSKCPSTSREWFVWSDISWIQEFIEENSFFVDQIVYTDELEKKVGNKKKSKNEASDRAFERLSSLRPCTEPRMTTSHYLNIATCLQSVIEIDNTHIDPDSELYRTRHPDGEPPHSYFASLVCLVFMNTPAEDWKDYFEEATIDPTALALRVIRESLALHKIMEQAA